MRRAKDLQHSHFEDLIRDATHTDNFSQLQFPRIIQAYFHCDDFTAIETQHMEFVARNSLVPKRVPQKPQLPPQTLAEHTYSSSTTDG